MPLARWRTTPPNSTRCSAGSRSAVVCAPMVWFECEAGAASSPGSRQAHAELADPRLGYGVSQRTQRDRGADQRWLPRPTAATAILAIRSAG
jgi:hypothetical protein